MKTILFFTTSFIVICVMACTSSQKVLTGKFSNRKSNNILYLFPDSSFRYEQTLLPGSRFKEKYSSGKWSKLDENTLVLNSNKQERKVSVNVDIKSSKNSNSVMFIEMKVDRQDQINYISQPIFSPPASQKYIGVNSYAFDIASKKDSVYIVLEKRPLKAEILGLKQPEYYTVETDIIPLDYSVGDSIILHLSVPDSLFSYRIFNNEAFKMKGNKIVFADIEEHKNNILSLD